MQRQLIFWHGTQQAQSTPFFQRQALVQQRLCFLVLPSTGTTAVSSAAMYALSKYPGERIPSARPSACALKMPVHEMCARRTNTLCYCTKPERDETLLHLAPCLSKGPPAGFLYSFAHCNMLLQSNWVFNASVDHSLQNCQYLLSSCKQSIRGKPFSLSAN